MTLATQTFRGAVHRVTFRFEAARGAGRPLVVCFADLGGDSELPHARELAPLDLNRLYVLDDFGPYTDRDGYAGCWYLGEARSFSFADDVAQLVREVQREHDVADADTIAVGRGKGGYAALWHAVRHGWGTALVGTPHVRLGRLLGDDGLRAAARFIAGGEDGADLRWLDGLLAEEIARAPRLPAIWLHASVREPAYAQHVLPLVDVLKRRGARLELDTGDHGSGPQAAAAFATRLFARLGGSHRRRPAAGAAPAGRGRADLPVGAAVAAADRRDRGGVALHGPTRLRPRRTTRASGCRSSRSTRSR